MNKAMFKRLQAGNVVHGGEPAKAEGSVEGQLRKLAVLVHAGPDGEKAVFVCGDGTEIEFDAAKIQRVVDNQNKYIQKLAEEYGGLDKMPLGAFQPMLDSHKDDSNDRVIGRLGDLLEYRVMDLPKVGKNVPCAVTWITFLGKETIERVNDGRIYHLSVGIQDETETLGETSTVVEPAAPGAMLLSKGKPGATQSKTPNGGNQMPKLEQLKKLKAARTARLTKLSALKEQVGGFKKTTADTSDRLRLERSKAETHSELVEFMRKGKLTPAEYKELTKDDGLVRMSKMEAEGRKTLMRAFEVRQPVIEPGQRGSTAATEFSEMGKSLEKNQMKRLKAEVRQDLARLSGKKLKAEDDDKEPKKDLAAPDAASPKKDDPGAGEMDEMKAAHLKHMGEMKKHLEAGDLEQAKKCYAEMAAHDEKSGMKHMSAPALEGAISSDVKSEDYKKSMDALQGQIDELNTQMARIGGALEELMEAEKAEGHQLDELEKGEEEKPAEGQKPGEQAAS